MEDRIEFCKWTPRCFCNPVFDNVKIQMSFLNNAALYYPFARFEYSIDALSDTINV